MKKTRLGKKLLTFLLAMVMVVELITPTMFTVVSASNAVYPGGTSGIADRDTSTKYTLSLGDNASTENAGRIWSDKSVYADDVTFDTFGGNKLTYKLNENGALGEDFLVAFSALASTDAIEGQTQAPVDVVLILDVSGSMSNTSSGMDNGNSRIANAVEAANNAIETIMALNPYSRVAVVAFSTRASVLLPLDRYEKATTVERVWVSTGIWGGYWQEKEVILPYFSLSTVSPSRNYSTLYTRAVGEKTGDVNISTDVEGGTNIQMGLYTGMNILAKEPNTKININGSMVQRVPSVIMLSDGAPTYSSNSAAWWSPSNNSSNGSGNSPNAGNGFKAVLTGAYMKSAIDRNYGVSGTKLGTTVYTVGMGITGLSGDSQRLAYLTLDPGSYWNTSGYNDMRDTFKQYWSAYTSNGNTGTVEVEVEDDENYTVVHPTTGYDISPVNGYDYVDDYYDADNASAVADVFKEIVSSISVSAPQIPTELKGDNPISDGYITYTDPIGQYMEVKDVKAIIYAGSEFKNKTVTTENGVTTYTFSGEVHSPVYGDQSISSIIIKVTENSDGSQTLVVRIPALVIPLRVNYVTLNADGSVKSHTNNGAFPARVIYSVGMDDDVINLDDDGDVYIDTTAVSPEYIAKNTNEKGEINFYSNLYTNSNTVHGYTAGDATVEFEPSHTNRYYYILEDTPIYKDAAFTQQVTAAEGLRDNTTYYYHMYYYHGSSRVEKATARTGAQLKLTDINTGDDGYLYRAAGSPRLNRILDFEGTKVENATATARNFYAPTFEYAPGSTDPYEGKFVIYMGNNGVISLPVGGNLELTKQVTSEDGITPPDKSFAFTFDLDGERVNQGEFDYVIKNIAGETVGNGKISAASPVINLKAGETATVYSLPPDTQYKITEGAVDGFTANSTTAQGVIDAGKTSQVLFINDYSVTPVTYPTNGGVAGVKVLEGRDWTANDEFTFYFAPYNNAPLPNGYNAETGIVVTSSDVIENRTALIDFGNITFTAPGVYRYTIYEMEPEVHEALPGMAYSSALYRLVVTVEDNGNGALEVVASDLQRLYDDSANQLFTYGPNREIVMNQGEEGQDTLVFTNKYSASSVVRVPVAMKDYTDASGSKPLVSGMFEFKFEALGYVVNGVESDDVTKVPMPEGAVNGVVITTNEGRNVTFPAVELKQEHIPDGCNSITFKYRMSEVIPSNPLYGMDYDSSVYDIECTVSVDGTDDVLKVDVVFPNNERIITFKNVYTPDSAEVIVNGNKTLNGRDMKAGEGFTFEIEGADSFTAAAINNGTVLIPSSSAVVSGGKDGVASQFSFNGITVSKVGTYKFNVKEVAGTSPAIEYDSTVVEVTVVIADENGDGKLEVKTITYSNGKNAAEFVNNYSAEFDGTPVSLKGIKNLNGKTLLAGEFFFNVVEYYNGNYVTEGLVSHAEDTVGNGNGVYSGEIKFIENRTYDKIGTYTYIITEQIPNPKVGGTTYDESQYRFTVVVDDVDKEGKLTVVSTSLEKASGSGWTAVNSVEFNNKYVPTPAEARLPLIKKVLAGERSEPLKEGEFSFEIKSVSQSVAGGMILPSQPVVTNGADGSVVFGNITFTRPGTYVVSVTEVIPDDGDKVAGITYSAQQIIATFNVVDDRNGNLHALRANYTGGEVIVNNYTATPGVAEIKIEKDFTGRPNDEWLDSDKFDFDVVVLDEATRIAIEEGYIEFPTDVGSSDIAVKTIARKGEVITDTVKVHRAGTYKFIVREKMGTIPGIIYDSNPREIVIVATDNSATANIDIKINGNDTDKITLTFTNVYDASSTELSGHDDLTVTKNFTGRPNDEWLDSDEFVFVLETADSVTAAAVSNGDVVLPANTTLKVSNANKAHPHFGNIQFNKMGTYKFKITEQAGSIPGVTYDTAEKIITVKVVDSANGELVATVVANESDALVFNNTYSVSEVTLEGAVALTVTKVINGREWNEDDSFTFVIEPFGEVTESAIANNEIVMSSNTMTVAATDLNSENGKTNSFGNIVFKTAGNYRFRITEKSGNIDKVTYDNHVYHVLVSVYDNDMGQLATTVSYIGSNVFINEYTPDNGEAVIGGTKVLNGNRVLGADEFEFVIKAVTLGAPMPEKLTAKNDANGKIDFGKVIYVEEGTYVYEITETEGNIPGVTYDKEKVTVTVTVEYDEIAGKFEVEVAYAKGTAAPKAEFEFVNEYVAEKTEPVSIGIEKEVKASEGNSYTMVGGEFTFEIVAEGNAPLPADTTVENGADGKAVFGDVVFDKVGTYKYTVKEVKGTLGGFTYDTKEYKVTVTVTDDTANAKLVADVVITDANGQPTDIVFENSYDPTDASAEIFGQKVVEGGYRDVTEDEFSFVITAVTENAPLPANTKVKNDANGRFRFDTITFTKVGIYEYKITEENLGVYGYTYDTTAYTVKVTVVDENGQLKATVEGIGTAVEPAIKFVNTYIPDAANFEIDGKKILEGIRDLAANEFEFELKDGEGKVIDSVKNGADGKFKFAVSYTKAGVYEYTVTEKANGMGGITYDGKTYSIKVTVVDNNGKLEITDYSCKLEGNEVREIVFTNTYTVKEAKVQIEAKKSLLGRDLAAEEFAFTLKDANGAVIATVRNVADGTVKFDEMTYGNVGVYKYTVSEVEGNLDGVNYDKTVYEVTVTVTDDGQGNLVAKTVINKAGSSTEETKISFVNTYNPPNVPQTSDRTHLGMWFAMLFISGMGVAVTSFFGKKRARSAK